MDVKYHFIRNHIENNEDIIYHIDIKSQLADLLTKPLGNPLFFKFRRILNICD